MRFHVALGLLLALFVLPTPASAELPVAPFEARYTVYAKGFPVGESILTLSDAGDGRYQMKSDVRPSGPAALLITDSLSEQVSGEIRGDRVLPTVYEQERGGGKKAGLTRLEFDWVNTVVRAKSPEDEATLPLSNGVVDPLSLHLQVMWDLRRGLRPDTYTLAQDTELKTYEVKFEGEETVSTPLGKLRALRVTRTKARSNRVTTFWFAPDLKYLLVQVAQSNKGSETLRLVIDKVTGLEAPK